MPSNRARTLVWTCLALLMAGCAQAPLNASSMLDTEWRLVALSGDGLVATRADRHPGLRFVADAGVIQGSGGCNRYSASYVLNEDSVEFGPALRTKMGCAPEISQQEDRFLDALAAVRRWAMDGSELVMRSESGTISLRFAASSE